MVRNGLQKEEDCYWFALAPKKYIVKFKWIQMWIGLKRKKRNWANYVGLIGLFEVEWKTPKHELLEG
jgi:hypothetical protein